MEFTADRPQQLMSAAATLLSQLTSHNSQGEYYLTDTVSLLQRAGRKAAVVCAPDHRELLGINTVEQLTEAERIHREMGATP